MPEACSVHHCPSEPLARAVETHPAALRMPGLPAKTHQDPGHLPELAILNGHNRGLGARIVRIMRVPRWGVHGHDAAKPAPNEKKLCSESQKAALTRIPPWP